MKRRAILSCMVLVAGIMATSCSLEDRNDAIVDNLFDNVNTDYKIKGMACVKVNEDLSSVLEARADKNGEIRSIGVKSSDDVLAGIHFTYMKRLCPPCGKYEERTRKEGLHRWYAVYFDESTPLTKAGNDISKVEGIEYVEFRPKIRMADYSRPTEGQIRAFEASVKPNNISSVFNDPMAGDQWHYVNEGGYPAGAEKGCDINVLPVWENGFYGSDEVIVAVVDGGVQCNHPDLADNIWVNEYEANGQPGVDDDGNGYTDDIYGFNFVSWKGEISQDAHGTHVAGTIAAVNNNGVGVCGVAGGNKGAGIKGVKIMSCQIFSGERGGDHVSAIKYAADNGAVICQNSWGYDDPEMTEVPQYDKEVIDYFIKHAGCDTPDHQIGPMKGGLVIFAAGNEDAAVGLPGMYEKCLAVASVAADYTRAYYSNYGDWVDVAAPGGDAQKNQLILSTSVNNGYEYFQGTSMACPHVSGVAALVVSRMKGLGLVPDDVRDVIEKSCSSIDSYNGAYAGKLGKGLVNVAEAINGASIIAPDPVTDLAAEGMANNIKISFTVPKDEDNVKPSNYNIYFRAKEFSNDFDVENLPEGMHKVTIESGAASVGSRFEYILSHESLDFCSRYYVAVSALDRSGNMSDVSDVVSVETTENHAPYFEPGDDIEMTLAKHETKVCKLSVLDPDMHKTSISIDTDESKVISFKKNSDGTVNVIVDAKKALPEVLDYKATLKVEDPYGMSSTLQVKVSVIRNHAPVVIGTIENIVFKSTGLNQTIDLAGIFSDEDQEQLMYRVAVDPEGIVDVSFSKDIMTLKSRKTGLTNVKLTAKDVSNASVEILFQVMVADPAKPVDIYPNPVVDFVNFRSTVEVSGAVLTVINANGVEVFRADNVAIGPFDPYQIDMKNLPSGVYTVKIVSGEQEIMDRIIKL